LVIKKEYKALILALVKSHAMGSTEPGSQKSTNDVESMDLVSGKGKGLVILLHGGPGLGKTSTAETVARYTKRALYPITCGDLGERADEVDKALQRHFNLAHRWGCVLLLDEADVFLAQRSERDVQRNAIVSGKYSLNVQVHPTGG
jgi:SpoVK/Ycf46/Vps4 family AAA+-type ATPase